MRCDCHGRQHSALSLTVLRPAQRYPTIDPMPEPVGAALYVCGAWLAERERQRAAQEKRQRIPA